VLAQLRAQVDRWPLWTPVAFGCGCGLYFGLPREPALALLAGLAAASILAALALRRWGRAPVAAGVVLLLAFGAAGTLAAKVQTLDLAGPVAPAMAGVTVEGWVVDLASRGTTGPRLLIAPTFIRGLRPDLIPKRVRVTVHDDAVIGPGAAVRFTVLLNPPPAPASPGAFDFARSAYFNGVGGVGVALKPPTLIDLPRPPWRLELQLQINRARWALTRRIIDAMGQPAGGIAAAMITGHDYSITQSDTNEMRNAGISHILSISGVHMAIVGGFIFFSTRLLISILLYLVVSGWPPPAQRSAVTASVAFGAMLLDRRAISLRGLGISALIVLLLQPEAVVEPGFQMSYAATVALVALADIWPHPQRAINAPLAIRVLQKAKDWLVAGIAVGTVAGAATAPFAIEHFNRVWLYGLPANLLLEPLSSFVIMPALAPGRRGPDVQRRRTAAGRGGVGHRPDAGAGPHHRQRARRHDHHRLGADLGAAGGLHRHPVAVPVARTAEVAGPAPGSGREPVAAPADADDLDRLQRGQRGGLCRRPSGAAAPRDGPVRRPAVDAPLRL
jgi:competence protein ComEC